MTVTTTTRLGLTRWSSINDEFSREQMDQTHANLEDRAARFEKGAVALRPSASAATDRMFWMDPNQGNANWRPIYYSDGSNWYELNTFGSPTSLTVGGSNSDGSGYRAARNDHVHALPGWGTPVAVGTAISDGSANTFARSDHVHVLGPNSVTAGTIAAGAINSSDCFAPGILGSATLDNGSVTRSKLAESERIPIGTIFLYVGTTAPVGYLLCNGASVSKTTYANLYSVVQGRFGESGGNFNLPNLQGRIALGWGSGRNVGDTGGNASITLTTSQLPAHSHDYTTSQSGSHTHSMGAAGGHSHSGTTAGQTQNHTHAISVYSVDPQGTAPSHFGLGAIAVIGNVVHTTAGVSNDHAHNFVTNTISGHTHSIGSSSSHSHSGTTNATGGGSSVNILNPYLVVSFIIKY